MSDVDYHLLLLLTADLCKRFLPGTLHSPPERNFVLLDGVYCGGVFLLPSRRFHLDDESTLLAHSSLKEAKLHRQLEANHEKFVNKPLVVFKEKEYQVKRSRFDHPTAWGRLVYSHNKAVRVSFSAAWIIIAREIDKRLRPEADENACKCKSSVKQHNIYLCEAGFSTLAMVKTKYSTGMNFNQQTISDVR
ncbi:unnamed protein product [Clavelina lepadiformis]|uniref:DDE Tnp4 domain-containing protein n=1 Tax=Clavelina lepadiformis TaxID=159417 RepID=A0ABP0GBY0_CLALP